MKQNLVIVMVVGAMLLVALPTLAQESEAVRGKPCGIEGTWYGSNTAGFNFVFRMEKNAAGGYSMVADGFGYLPTGDEYCTNSSAWHGELAKIGPKTYRFRQLELCDPTPEFLVFVELYLGVTIDPGTILLWGSEGTLTLQGCNQIEADIPFNGAYEWGSGAVPFDDLPIVEFGYITGLFDRMPRP